MSRVPGTTFDDTLRQSRRPLIAAVSFRLADLAPGHLGSASGSTVQIDRDAAGWGWYVDPTPAADAEFAACRGELRAGAGSPAEGRMDLLTVVMHELGHVLGDNDLPVADHLHDLMAENLPTGVRRLPSGAASAATLAGSSVPLPGDACAQPVANTTTLAVSPPANGIGGVALFDIGMVGPVLAGLAMRRRATPRHEEDVSGDLPPQRPAVR